jgi:hypothetical protein
MWLYPGPSCRGRPFSEELGKVEINTRIHKFLVHGANFNPGAGPAPLREGVDNTRVSPHRSTFLAIPVVQSSHRAHIFAQGLLYARNAPRGVTLPDDAARQEANHAHNEKLWAQKQRRQA